MEQAPQAKDQEQVEEWEAEEWAVVEAGVRVKVRVRVKVGAVAAVLP